LIKDRIITVDVCVYIMDIMILYILHVST